MTIYLSCGHVDDRKPLGFTLYMKEEVCDAIDGFSTALSSGQYCSDCAALLIKNCPDEVWTNYDDARFEVFGG